MNNLFKRITAALKSKANSDLPAGPSFTRKTVVSGTHVGQWDENKFTIILIANGAPEVTLALDEKISKWTSGEDVRTETKWILGISRHSGQVIPMGTFEDVHLANVEFDRMAQELINSHFSGAPVASPVVTENPKQPARGLFKRALIALGPWVGGGLAVILFSLAMTSNTPSAPTSSAPTATESLARAPEAWNALTQEQKDLLLNITAKAAGNYSGQSAEGIKAGISGAASGNPVPQSAPVPAATAVEFAKLTPDQLKKVKASFSLKIGTGPKVFYAFEDPLCSACRHFAIQSRSLDPSYGLVVLPIGFQAGGRDMAAAAICDADPKSAWSTVMSGNFFETKPCADGYKKVDANNALFLALGMTATPTMVSANGALIAGSGETLEIAQWVDKNAK